MDIEIFTLLRVQAIDVYTFLLVMRDFASGKGLQSDVDKINAEIAENKYIRSLANQQLSELQTAGDPNRLGLFEKIFS